MFEQVASNLRSAKQNVQKYDDLDWIKKKDFGEAAVSKKAFVAFLTEYEWLFDDE